MTSQKEDRWLMVIASACALLFCVTVHRLRPLPPIDLFPDRDRLTRQARAFLNELGLPADRAELQNISLSVPKPPPDPPESIRPAPV
ncbi:MAG: hypothetical protein SFU56_13025 [Capsulimonadales bacterium]|nr:hypothetical protein [Capsulimonadales bacterium]